MARSICSITKIIISPAKTWWCSVNNKLKKILVFTHLLENFLLSNISRGRNQNGFIHDDHRPVNSSKQLRNSNKTTTTTHRRKTTKSTKAKGQQKRRTSRKSKKRNENSKSEGKNMIIFINEYSNLFSYLKEQHQQQQLKMKLKKKIHKRKK